MCAKSTGDMQDGFGTGITFDAGDNDGTISSQVAEINAVRAGSDDIFNLELQTGDVSRLTLGTTGATIATGTVGTDRFKVDSSGNVGINTGTNSITEKLDVVGNIAVSGTVDGRDVAGDGTKLDGVEASADVTDTTNVVAALSAGTGISLSNGGVIANTSPDQTVALTGAGATSISGTYPNFTITSTDTNTTYTAGTGITLTGTEFQLTDTNAKLNLNGGTLTGNLTVPTLYLNNTDTRLQQGGQNSARIQTNSGYLDIGPWNTSYCHFYTDRGQFYFDKPVHFDGQIYNYVSGSTAQPYWHAGNDGSGSGLDADTVDGVQASSFLRSDANDIKTGTFNLQTNLDMASDSGTAARYVNLPRGGGITFYGNAAVNHSITSRNSGGTVTDDLFMQSYGGIFLGLDSNANNSSSADFKIVTNGNSTARLTFSGENYGLTVSGNVTAYSDKRLKDDIQPIENALEKVGTLSGNTYLRNDLPETDTDRRYAGVIAQEVEVVLPEAVSEAEDGTKTVDYNAVIALLVESIKELKAEVEQLKGGS